MTKNAPARGCGYTRLGLDRVVWTQPSPSFSCPLCNVSCEINANLFLALKVCTLDVQQCLAVTFYPSRSHFP